MLNSARLILFLAAAFSLSCDHDGAAPAPLPHNLALHGTYALQSPIEVPPTVLAAGPAADFLSLLKQLRTDPAAALFSALDEAGVPLAKDLFGVLPGALKDTVRSAINDHMVDRLKGDGGAGSELDQLLAFADSSLARFTLRSTLVVPEGIASGPVVGAHSIDTLVFELPGDITIPVAPEVLQRAMLFPGALNTTPMVSAAAGGGDATMTIGDHAFGLAYGEAIFSVLDGGGTGENLRARLGRIFDCPAMGHAVSKRCVSILCIGHASEVTAICDQGLDYVVKEIHGQLADLDFRALHFERGTGWAWDAPTGTTSNDGLVSRLDHGTWKASLDVGTGPRDCKASFTGTRQE